MGRSPPRDSSGSVGPLGAEKGIDTRANGVAHAAKSFQALLLGACGGGRVGEAPMFLEPRAREERALLSGGVADCHDQIEALASIGVQAFRAMPGPLADVYAHFRHR